MVDPSDAELADALGVAGAFGSTRARGSEPACDLAIVGAGPAGAGGRPCTPPRGIRTVVVEREVIGGQAGASSLIRNYLGFPRGITGAELAQRAYQQAWLFGAEYVLARAVSRLTAQGDDRWFTRRRHDVARAQRDRRAAARATAGSSCRHWSGWSAPASTTRPPPTTAC
jgi:thioredoxin reductase (NADPH)